MAASVGVGSDRRGLGVSADMALADDRFSEPARQDRVTPETAVQRNAGLDALRASLTLLVLFHHAAITYGASGDWYYVEVPAGHGLTSLLLSLFTGFNQAFFMGLLFLLAGYFTPGAVERHGPVVYLGERALRLGLPLVLYVVLLSPVTMALAGTARGRPFAATFVAVWTRGRVEPGPLWFCEALLIFACLYLALRTVAPGMARARACSFPSDRTLALAAFGTGCAAFALRLVWPTGTTLLHLQLGYFASYVLLFAAGCAAASWPNLDRAPAPQRRLWIVIACATFPVMPVAVVLGNHVAWLAGSQSGGWTLQAAVYALWEPFLAWGVIMALLHLSSRWPGAPHRAWRSLSRRAYAIYIIHPPVLVVLALAWRSVAAPPPLKLLATGSATCLVCYLLAGLLLDMPGARRIL